MNTGAARAEYEKYPAGAPKLLIVDDMSWIRQRLRDLLEQEGFSIIGEADDGDEAVAMTRQLNPDLVVMDYVMKRMNGLEATYKIREAGSGARIVIMTQSPSPSLVIDSFRAGAINFIIKPFEDRQFLSVVRRALSS